MGLDPVAATLAAGLGGAAIAGGCALGVAAIQARSARLGGRDAVKRGAYSRLLAATGLMVHTAHALQLTVQFRSGIKEGLDVTTGTRKPMDPLELNRELRRDLEPLYQSWAEVTTVGSPAAIRVSNELIGKVVDVVGAATARGDARTGLARLLAGEKWTQRQRDDWNAQIRVLAASRREFGLLARKELGCEFAELFLEAQSPKTAAETAAEDGGTTAVTEQQTRE